MINLQSFAYELAMGKPVRTERTAPCNCCFQPTRAHKLNADKVCPECVEKGAVKCADCGEFFLPEWLADGLCDVCREVTAEDDFRSNDDYEPDCCYEAHCWAESNM